MDKIANNTFLWGMLAGAVAYHLIKNTSINVNLLRPNIPNPAIQSKYYE